jgi:Fe-S cluster biogenesis protein NfuA
VSPVVEEIRQKVEEILEKKIRPIIRQDGGDIRVGEIREDGTLVLVYRGRCSGCPAVEWTHGSIVQPAILDAVKEIKKIEWSFEYGY